jgi:Ca2+-binding RTX toxin-like protein
MILKGHLIVVVGAFLMGGAVLLVVGCAGVRSVAPEEGQGHTQATKQEQERSPEATASEEARCGGTGTVDLQGHTYTTNDVSGCPPGGLLSGTDRRDNLHGKNGDDEIHSLGADDWFIYGGAGNDVIHGGPGSDLLLGNNGDDVLYGGDGGEENMEGGKGEDVLYGGDGSDVLGGAVANEGEDVFYGGEGDDGLDGMDRPGPRGLSLIDTQRDELYCGPGNDHYHAGKLDYVDSSCEKKFKPRVLN